MKSGLSFKKNKSCRESDDPDCGDYWAYTAIARDSGLMIAHYGGKRTDTTCKDFLNLVFEKLGLPFPSMKIAITTDGNSQYIDAFAELYCETCIEYGQLLKHREKNRIVAINPRKIFGDPEISKISTSVVEGYNNKIRPRISRFGRKKASFSKKIVSYVGALNIFQFMNNFIDAKQGRTPAMKEGMTDHVWIWREYLTCHIQL